MTAENLVHTFVIVNCEKGTKAHITNKDLVIRPGQNMGGALLTRKQLSTINRIRTYHGRCGSLLFRRHYKDIVTYDRVEVEQTDYKSNCGNVPQKTV